MITRRAILKSQMNVRRGRPCVLLTMSYDKSRECIFTQLLKMWILLLLHPLLIHGQSTATSGISTSPMPESTSVFTPDQVPNSSSTLPVGILSIVTVGGAFSLLGMAAAVFCFKRRIASTVLQLPPDRNAIPPTSQSFSNWFKALTSIRIAWNKKVHPSQLTTREPYPPSHYRIISETATISPTISLHISPSSGSPQTRYSSLPALQKLPVLPKTIEIPASLDTKSPLSAIKPHIILSPSQPISPVSRTNEDNPFVESIFVDNELSYSSSPIPKPYYIDVAELKRLKANKTRRKKEQHISEMNINTDDHPPAPPIKEPHYSHYRPATSSGTHRFSGEGSPSISRPVTDPPTVD